MLAAISHRIRGNISGQLLINGLPVTRQEVINQSSFVPQFDITLDHLTCKEHLVFMCELRLDRYMPWQEKLQKISNILWTLGLEKVEHSRISVLSGGERKKLNLATEVSEKIEFFILTQAQILTAVDRSRLDFLR